jgi:hypothetical protein
MLYRADVRTQERIRIESVQNPVKITHRIKKRGQPLGINLPRETTRKISAIKYVWQGTIPTVVSDDLFKCGFDFAEYRRERIQRLLASAGLEIREHTVELPKRPQQFSRGT